MTKWEASLVRKFFHHPFSIFRVLYDMTISNGRCDQSKMNSTHLPCKDLELLLLGELYSTLATAGASHLYVFIQAS